MKYILPIFFFFIVASMLCQSCREEATSACPLLVAADSMMWSNPDSALLVLEQVPTPQELQGRERALYSLLLTQARYKSCVPLENDSLIRIAVDYYQKGKEKERLAQAYFYQGCVYAEQKEQIKAIELYLKSLELMLDKGDSIFKAMIYSHLGNSYNEQDLHSTARDMYRKGYNLCAAKDSTRSFYALKDIGDTFLLEYQLDSALSYYQHALKMATFLQDSECLSLIYKNIAGLYSEQNQYIEAESNLSKALPYLTVEEDYTSACSIKGNILSFLNKNDSAIYYWKIGVSSPNIYVKTSAYHHLYQEYKVTKELENAIASVDSFLIYYDSIQTMNNRAELDKLMDDHLVELHKQKLSAERNWIIAGLIIIFLILAAILIILYLWRDGCRKKKYIDLQRRLMENRAEALLLSEITEATSDRNAELQELEKEQFKISLSLFEATAGSKKLDELKKTTPAMQVKMADRYRIMIVSDIRKSFANVMGNLKERYPSLTNDDLLYCVLSLLGCHKDIILHLTNVSADAIKVRKSRIKGKVDAEQFARIFMS